MFEILDGDGELTMQRLASMNCLAYGTLRVYLTRLGKKLGLRESSGWLTTNVFLWALRHREALERSEFMIPASAKKFPVREEQFVHTLPTNLGLGF